MSFYARSENALTGTNFDAAHNAKRRGLNVYTMNEVIGVTGRDKSGQLLHATIEQPLFSLSIYDRIQIFEKCDPVFGCVTSRANRVSAQVWQVTTESRLEDRTAEDLKHWYQLYREYDGTIAGIMVRAQMYRAIKGILPDVLPDLSNFQQAMMRWRRRLRSANEDRCTEIEDWLHEPNQEDDFDDMLKKGTVDAMVHGNISIYKEYNKETGLLENFYCLPGGSTVPLRNRYVGGPRMFAQIVPGEDPKIYFGDEITFMSYMPSTALAYGMVPLEALVNKVAESLFFDSNAAQRADGETVPEKAVIFGENSPFGDTSLTGNTDYSIPIDKDEQTKLETIFNEPRKNAIKVLSGYGTPLVLDLSRSDTFATQQERQKFIRECTAFVFNMSNMEVNLTGSENTSGRSTSEEQGDIDREKGYYPIMKMWENKLNREIIPARFGSNHIFEFNKGSNEKEQLERDRAKMDSRTYSINEIRTDRGDDPFNDPKYDLPTDQAPALPDGTQSNPLMTRAL